MISFPVILLILLRSSFSEILDQTEWKENINWYYPSDLPNRLQSVLETQGDTYHKEPHVSHANKLSFSIYSSKGAELLDSDYLHTLKHETHNLPNTIDIEKGRPLNIKNVMREIAQYSLHPLKLNIQLRNFPGSNNIEDENHQKLLLTDTIWDHNNLYPLRLKSKLFNFPYTHDYDENVRRDFNPFKLHLFSNSHLRLRPKILNVPNILYYTEEGRRRFNFNDVLRNIYFLSLLSLNPKTFNFPDNQENKEHSHKTFNFSDFLQKIHCLNTSPIRLMCNLFKFPKNLNKKDDILRKSSFTDGIRTVQIPDIKYLRFVNGHKSRKRRESVPQWFEDDGYEFIDVIDDSPIPHKGRAKPAIMKQVVLKDKKKVMSRNQLEVGDGNKQEMNTLQPLRLQRDNRKTKKAAARSKFKEDKSAITKTP